MTDTKNNDPNTQRNFLSQGKSRRGRSELVWQLSRISGTKAPSLFLLHSSSPSSVFKVTVVSSMANWGHSLISAFQAAGRREGQKYLPSLCRRLPGSPTESSALVQSAETWSHGHTHPRGNSIFELNPLPPWESQLLLVRRQGVPV